MIFRNKIETREIVKYSLAFCFCSIIKIIQIVLALIFTSELVLYGVFRLKNLFVLINEAIPTFIYLIKIVQAIKENLKGNTQFRMSFSRQRVNLNVPK